MVVSIEFFSRDFLQNVVTCLKCDVDKVIFVGYEDVMDEGAKNRHENILKNVAKVKEVEFISVDREAMSDIKFVLDKAVQAEKANKNNVFFDLTGGENLVLVAAGIIANKYQLPVKRTDIKKNRVIEYTSVFYQKSYMTDKKNEKTLSIADYIYMQGACINKNAAKDFKQNTEDLNFSTCIKKIWDIRKRYVSKWNLYCMVISELKKFENGEQVLVDNIQLKEVVNKRKISEGEFIEFLKALEKDDLICNISYDSKTLSYKIKDSQIDELLCDPGSILELYCYVVIRESGLFEECRIGVHIDWDGKINTNNSLSDVLNEIDLMMIKDNKPIFVSCKNGKIDNNVLYELDAVASALGGKYAKKVLITTSVIKEVFLSRAKEMNIHIIDKNIYKWDENSLRKIIAGFLK